MKRYLLTCTALAALAVLLSQPLAAQEKQERQEKQEKKEKQEKEEKWKLSDNEEIIIKRKGDKDTKVTIEIKGDEVTVNGKPLEEFNDEDIVIKKGRSGYTFIAPHSPFRGQGGTLNFNDNNFSRTTTVPFLGVVTEKAEKGAKIEEITEGSGAEKAGLKEGDVITKIDDAVITSAEDVTKAIRKHKPEDKITITYERDGKTDKTTATLGKRKTTAFNFESPRFEMPDIEAMPDFKFNWDGPGQNRSFSYSGRPRLGIKAQDTEDSKGAKVLDVDEESAAEKAGIKEDDIITEFDGKKVNSAEELAAAAREAKDKNLIKITFLRNGKSQTAEVKIPKKLKTANL